MSFDALRLTSLAVLIASAAVVGAPRPASAEVISASFATPDGGVTTGLYDGLVQVTVSGGGNSNGIYFNDAFYWTQPGVGPTHDGNYYQLTFSLTALQPLAPAQDAYLSVVGGLPAYNPSNTYSFLLNTGASVPTALHFGVSDGVFGDNSGAYSISLSQVPEPASIALVGMGLAGVAVARRRRRTTA